MLKILKRMKKKGIKILVGLILSALIIANVNACNRDDKIVEEPSDLIVIRVGEWGNDNEVKAGKRAYVQNIKNIPTDIPLRKDEEGFFISEFDINKKLATKITECLSSKGIIVDLQIATEHKQDLNSAGRIARSKNPTIYLSIHHNAYANDSSGYFFMVNEHDYKSDHYAKNLSDSIIDNPLDIPQLKNRINDGYIGEMNELKETDSIVILGEFGFFSNPQELLKIMDNEQIEYIANNISDELIKILEKQ